jgi:hypothetical protein
MVYTKRPPKSYFGPKCGHRKNICENHCSRALRKVYILKVSERSMLNKTFGPNTNVATGGWRKLHSEELH